MVNKFDELLKQFERKEPVDYQKAWDSLKEELKRKYDMESERLKRSEKELENNLYNNYIIGKITGQRNQLLNAMLTIASLEGTNEFKNLLSDLEDDNND
ncbi:hypothetical protein [Staphylococcus shinii]|uniref:hypothetical protein n=1 Tax=Staphylococcus shinii TaxID=2912228 RepID=UPI00298F2947|nr:hypothetical protein [Staphylococcus shinii]MDW8571174.1 hypothetical protein [Staphylococcus shinii]MDW8572921.1 hypothetical protein [Staphylococcus shinii]